MLKKKNQSGKIRLPDFRQYYKASYQNMVLAQKQKCRLIEQDRNPRSKRGYSSIFCKKITTPKTYKNEKAENYNSDKGVRKKQQQLSDQEILSL